MNRLDALFAQLERICPEPAEIADIGADHGYLTEKILKSGYKGRVIVTDIAEQPLNLAKKNLGQQEQIEYRKCDGLQGNFSNTDLVVIAGMGGDLIADIIRNARNMKENVVYVLQPMTNFEKVLKQLGEHYAYSYFANENTKHYRILVSRSEHLKIDESEIIGVPWHTDFDEKAEIFRSSREVILKKNQDEAVTFFEYQLKKQQKITKSVLQIDDLAKRSSQKEEELTQILQQLKSEKRHLKSCGIPNKMND